jgi:hypothetical protein
MRHVAPYFFAFRKEKIMENFEKIGAEVSLKDNFTRKMADIVKSAKDFEKQMKSIESLSKRMSHSFNINTSGIRRAHRDVQDLARSIGRVRPIEIRLNGIREAQGQITSLQREIARINGRTQISLQTNANNSALTGTGTSPTESSSSISGAMMALLGGINSLNGNLRTIQYAAKQTQPTNRISAPITTPSSSRPLPPDLANLAVNKTGVGNTIRDLLDAYKLSFKTLGMNARDQIEAMKPYFYHNVDQISGQGYIGNRAGKFRTYGAPDTFVTSNYKKHLVNPERDPNATGRYFNVPGIGRSILGEFRGKLWRDLGKNLLKSMGQGIGNFGKGLFSAVGNGLGNIVSGFRAIPSVLGGVGRAFGALGRAATAPIRGLNNLAQGFFYMTSSLSTVKDSITDFMSATIGKAMEMDMYQRTFATMMNSRNKYGGAHLESKPFNKWLEQKAVESMMPMTDFIQAGKAFTPYAHNNKQLQGLVEASELLAYYDPQQGMAGANFALKELLSGSSRSIRERFELPANTVKDIEKFVDKNDMRQAKNIDKVLELIKKGLQQVGVDENLVNTQNNSAMGQWMQLKDRWAVAWMTAGNGGNKVGQNNRFLDKVAEKLKEINQLFADGKFDHFSQTMGRAVEKVFDKLVGFADWLGENGEKITKPLNKLFDNIEEAFKNNTTIGGAMEELMTKGFEKIEEWATTHDKEITAAVDSFTQKIVESLAKAIPLLAEAAWPLGAAIVEGIGKGIREKMIELPVFKQLAELDQWTKEGDSLLAKILGGGKGMEYRKNQAEKEEKKKSSKKAAPKAVSPVKQIPGPQKAYATGTRNVPEDGYAYLHKGERVVKASENHGGSNPVVHINFGGVTVRKESDIDEITTKIVSKLKGALA